MNNIFAHALAAADSNCQAEFFNEFYRHLKLISKGRQENQLSYIADSLDENGREFAASLSEFAKLSVEARSKIEQEMSELYRQRRELEEEVAAMRLSVLSGADTKDL